MPIRTRWHFTIHNLCNVLQNTLDPRVKAMQIQGNTVPITIVACVHRFAP